ncbi:MAG: lytic polysaccharide monooxygenase [Kineosporiaceae bacterium]
MRVVRRGIGVGVAAALAAAALAATGASPAQAHGAAMVPGARTWMCWKDGVSPTGELTFTNAACAAAVAKSGTSAIYNWFGVLRADGGGRTTGFIPDGSLCSGAAKNFDFSGFDLPRDDWPLTHLTAGANLDIQYNNWAAHPGTFKLFVTKDGFDPTKPLAWSDLEETPFSEVKDPPQEGRVATEDGHYYWTAKLPANKTGRHIIYSLWVRSDSTENFYGCSDVVFDGGKGEITGIRGTSPNPTTSPTPTTSSPEPTTSDPAPTTSDPTPTKKTTKVRSTKKASVKKVTKTVKTCKTGKNGKPTCKTVTKVVKTTVKGKGAVAGAACTTDLAVTNAWGSGYEGVVTVTNTGTQALKGWSATVGGLSRGLTQTWGADVRASASGLLVDAGTADLAPGASVRAGFVASGAPAVGALTCSAG